MRPLRLAIVDDSTFVRKALCRIFEGTPSVHVVGAAATGEELLENLREWRPEVITLDLNMPGIGGLSTLDRIMAWRDIPVIILSTHSSEDAPLTIEALHRGAVDFIDKQQHSLVDFDGLRTVLLEKIRHVAGAQADPSAQRSQATAISTSHEPTDPPEPTTDRRFTVVVVGASTGGPPAVQQILQALKAPIPTPIVVVQHMPPGFTTAFAARLNAHLPFPVSEPSHGEALAPGAVYIAATGSHLHLDLDGDTLVARTTRFPEKISHRPSVDILFRSAANLSSQGVNTLALLLTGMGKDGAAGLLELAKSGAHTLAQNEATCVVYGMPKAAADLGAVREMLPLPAIGRRVNALLAGAHQRSSELR